MDSKPDSLSREERLAAKLRENLKRRKTQARALDRPGEGKEGAQNEGASNAALSKRPPKS